MLSLCPHRQQSDGGLREAQRETELKFGTPPLPLHKIAHKMAGYTDQPTTWLNLTSAKFVNLELGPGSGGYTYSISDVPLYSM